MPRFRTNHTKQGHEPEIFPKQTGMEQTKGEPTKQKVKGAGFKRRGTSLFLEGHARCVQRHNPTGGNITIDNAPRAA